MKIYEGHLHAEKIRTAIVVSRFNTLITRSLLEGAVDALKRHGAEEKQQAIFWVPGALEIPLLASKLAQSGDYDAVICLGAVIRGATPHFDIVANQTAAGIMQAGLTSGIPVIMGVLTTDTIDQALERAGTKAGNKGYDAAMTAIEMVNILNKL